MSTAELYVATYVPLGHSGFMTTPPEWQNIGIFGPEQAIIDVTYATSLPLDAALAWVEARLAEVQSHLANLGTKRNNLFLIYRLLNDVMFQMLS
jgi:hypothetical protein